MKNVFNPDKKQQQVIMFNEGRALVLGAPGCGKTDILAYRIAFAQQFYNVNFEDMLCLTFTNRASRNMKDRIKEKVGKEALNNLFVGNLHRFCIRFLFENELVPIDTCLIDDIDQEEIINEITGSNSLKAYQINAIFKFAKYEYMIANDFPTDIIPEVPYYDSKTYAQEYDKYKHENNLIDFDDVLLLTYKALMEPDYRKYKYSSYKWIQVDELQDLTPLQFAIIEKLIAPDFSSAVYLGDERQAIYSFLGAKEQSIEVIKREAGENFFMLSNNYRSPIYLLDMFNDFAIDVLNVNSEFLPQTTNKEYIDDGLVSVCCSQYEQPEVAAMLVRDIMVKTEVKALKESIGVLVRTNKDAEIISEKLTQNHISHITLTKKDIFKGKTFKLIHSHFSVVANETRYNDWSDILFRTRIFDKKTLASRFVKKVRELGIVPTDLVDYDDSSYFIEFDKSYRNKDIVIFDTETTGLDIFSDDIIQIAAMKIHKGVLVPGSELDIIIKTDKSIPPMLKEGFVNPMVQEYKVRSQTGGSCAHEYFMNAEDAFKIFIDYVGNAELLGHNINYDIHILENNIKRRTNNLLFISPICWDTLKLSRMLNPNLHRHNLESLLQVFGLKGENSHNAMDDIKATMSLAEYCHKRILPMLEQQIKFIMHPEVKKVQKKLIQKYYPIYYHTKEKLYSSSIDEEHTFLNEFIYTYNELVAKKYAESIKMFPYMCELFEKVVFDMDTEKYFYQQLTNHLYELRTFNEADLFQNGIITENVHIMTIHKAKGFEFDNVIIYDVTNGIFPHYNAQKPIEDAKVLYVGLSRAKKRVFVTYSTNISPFFKEHPKVYEHFYEMPQGQKEKLLKLNSILAK